ncbi:MAG TPA: fasciclin domain-containing protein [Drouetiella sp.]
MKMIRLVVVSAAMVVAASLTSQQAHGADKVLIAANKTQPYVVKEGFERKEKDIINTLKDNDVAKFSILLDGFIQAHSLDNSLKTTGPFTLFAPTDKAWNHMPDDDRMSLWANKEKLKQVLEYEIVDGAVKSPDLKKSPQLKTHEGHMMTITTTGSDIYADKAQIMITDIPCSNGVIHVMDAVIMPPLSK